MQVIVDDARLKKMIDFDVPNFLSKIERQYSLEGLDREEVIGLFLEKFCRYRFDPRRGSLNTFVYMNLRNVAINHAMRRKLETVSLSLFSDEYFRSYSDSLEQIMFQDFVGSLKNEKLPRGKSFVLGGREYRFTLRDVATLLYDGYGVKEIQKKFGVKNHTMNVVLLKIRSAYQKNI